MQYNFDEIINRKGSDCIKHDALQLYFGADDILPMWVADMDFKTPGFIIDAIKKRLEHEVLGYTFRGDGFFQSIIDWVKLRHNWKIERDWISFTPGVVPAITAAVLTFTEPGDKIIIQPPVYFPFFESVRGTKRRVLENPLKIVNGRFYFDLEDLESKIDEKTTMLLLCSPHNPGGTVWKKDELEAIAKICIRNNIMIVSDEIHADLLFSGQTHTPFTMLSDEIAKNSLVLMAPSKTFNVAGLSTAFAVIPDQAKLRAFERTIRTLHIGMGNIPGAIALEAAFNNGQEWLNQMMLYVEENYNFLENYFAEHLPKVKVMKPEATYLAWLDFRAYGMKDKELSAFMVEKAKVGLNNGARFGTGGDGFMRINIGCPRAVVAEALERIRKAFAALQV